MSIGGYDPLANELQRMQYYRDPAMEPGPALPMTPLAAQTSMSQNQQKKKSGLLSKLGNISPLRWLAGDSQQTFGRELQGYEGKPEELLGETSPARWLAGQSQQTFGNNLPGASAPNMSYLGEVSPLRWLAGQTQRSFGKTLPGLNRESNSPSPGSPTPSPVSQVDYLPPPPPPDPYVTLLSQMNERARNRGEFYQQQLSQMSQDKNVPESFRSVYQSTTPMIGNSMEAYADALTGSQAVLPRIQDLIDTYREQVRAAQAQQGAMSLDAMREALGSEDGKSKQKEKKG